MERPVQYFSDDYLRESKKLSPTQIARFLDDVQKLHPDYKPSSKSKLISMKVPEYLLQAFKTKCQAKGMRYQSQIKILMQEWLK